MSEFVAEPVEAVRVAQLEEAWELVALQKGLIRRLDRRARRHGRTLHTLTTAAQVTIGGGLAYALGEAIPAPPIWASATGLVVTVAAGRAVAHHNRQHGLVPAGSDALTSVRTESLRLGGEAFIGRAVSV